MTRRPQLRRRRRGRRAEWLLLGAVALAAAALAAPLGRPDAGDPAAPKGGTPSARAAAPFAAPPAASAAPAETRKLPVFARLRPDLVAEAAPARLIAAVPSDLEAALAAPAASRRATDVRGLEGALDPGLNTRKLPRPGDVPLPEKEAEELRQRVRPGFMGPAPYRVPFIHTDVIAPHLTPDVEVAVSDRAKLGVFGQVGPAGDAKAVPFPGIINRPLGAGVTLEYRFGTR